MIYGFPLVRAVLRSVQIGIPPVKSFRERLFVWYTASFYWRRHILGRRCNQCTYNLRISASWDSFVGSMYSFICYGCAFFSVTLCRGLQQYYDVRWYCFLALFVLLCSPSVGNVWHATSWWLFRLIIFGERWGMSLVKTIASSVFSFSW